MKPPIFVSLSPEGYVNEARHRHPKSPPQWGGEWVVYAPANTNLAAALAEIARLESERGNYDIKQ